MLKTPSRWAAAVRMVLAKLFGMQDVVLRVDGVALICGLGRGEGVWCALKGLDYEPELRLFLRHLKQGDVVIDLGANIGAYAIRAAKAVGAQGTVHAFEPLARTRDRLARAVQLNDVRNLSIVAMAAGSSSGTIQLAVNGRGISATIKPVEEASKSETVPVISIDDFVAHRGVRKLDWVKMDIEGAEPIALEGMRATIECFRPSFVFENESGGAEAATLLRRNNYKVGSFTRCGEFFETSHGMNLFAIPEEKILATTSTQGRDN